MACPSWAWACQQAGIACPSRVCFGLRYVMTIPALVASSTISANIAYLYHELLYIISCSYYSDLAACVFDLLENPSLHARLPRAPGFAFASSKHTIEAKQNVWDPYLPMHRSVDVDAPCSFVLEDLQGFLGQSGVVTSRDRSTPPYSRGGLCNKSFHLPRVSPGYTREEGSLPHLCVRIP